MIKTVIQQTSKRYFFTTALKRIYSPLSQEEFEKESETTKDPLALIIYNYNLKMNAVVKRLSSQLEDANTKDLVTRMIEKNLEDANFDLKDGTFSEAFLFFELGKIAFEKRDFEKSRVIFKKALEFIKNEDVNIPKVNNLKRAILDFYGQTITNFKLLDGAVSHYREAIDLSRTGSDLILSYLYLHLSQAQMTMLNFQGGKESAEKSLNMILSMEKNGNYYDIYLSCLKVLISACIYFKQFDKAIEHSFKGVELAREISSQDKEIDMQLSELKIYYITNNKVQFEQLKDFLMNAFKKSDYKSHEARINRVNFFELLKLYYAKDQEKYLRILAENYAFIKEAPFSKDELQNLGLEQIYKRITTNCDDIDKPDLTKEILSILSRSGQNLDLQLIYLEQLFETKRYEECLEGCDKLLSRGKLDEDISDDLKDIKYDALMKLGKTEEAKKLKDKSNCLLQ